MSRKRLLIISSVRWGYLWQRHQALAVAASQDGWTVHFLEPHPRNVRQAFAFVRSKLKRTRPHDSAAPVPPGVTVLPVTRWLKRSGRYDMVLCYIPDRWSELVIAQTGAHVLAYDAVLDWASVPASWYPPIGWRSAERRIAARSTAVLTDSPGMREVLSRRGISAEVIYPAADDEFLTPLEGPPMRSTAVYFGAVREEVDSAAIAAVARSGIETTVIGLVDSSEQREELEAAGVKLRPPVDVKTLVPLVRNAQVVLLPYRGERAASLVPAKLWNCLASGRWVVASGLALGLTAPNLVSCRPDEVVEEVARVVDSAPPPAGADLPTWSLRWRELLSHVATHPAL